ncbi:Predicted arabinose efflux permease, MFS family [Nonomuraea solani]|uniref:Predicted arabinose efflux permease, MFS family n=1 Tax=Nonomuraea solani TaxID=1144553 RepID=A0A1H6EVG8_9ACTN|nr:MFS transporter [Nonomuraea solani]SEH01081.1 Predicted arabinose efflux permease, MFS family [Nonomuraea solani]
MTSRPVTKAAVIGTAVEFYDHALFGLAAAIVLNERFFPADQPLAGTLGSFAAFAVGFLSRPLGGVVFGHFGDRVGRKPMLVVTLLLMGLSTAGIGLLPTYDQVGVAAPILLALLRLAQGFGAGAEYAGALVLVAETSDPRRRGLWASLPGAGVQIGILTATLVFTAVSALPSFETWGWRLPFLLSLAGVGVGLFLRFRVPESELFERERARGLSRFPALEVVRRQPRSLLIAFVANAPFGAIAYIINVFLLSYMTKTLGLPATVGLVGNVCSSAVAIVVTPLFGMLADRLGRRPVFLGTAFVLGVFAFPMFWLVDTGRPELVILAVTFGYGVCVAGMFAVLASLLTELFDTRHRYSGIAIAREWTAALSSGPAPLVAAALVAAAGGASWPVALLLVVCAAITFTAVLFAPETHHRHLTEPVSEPAMRTGAVI